MSTHLNGFHHLAMRVKDFNASVKFYTEGLGLRETIAWGEGDGRAMMLDAGNGNCVELFAGGAREPKPEGIVLHFAFRTDDCDGVLARAVAAGAVVTMEPKSLTIPSTPTPLPVRIAFCTGPDGEIIEFFQNEQVT